MTFADTSLIATGVPLCTCMASYTLPCDPLSSTFPKRYLRECGRRGGCSRERALLPVG